MELIQNNPYRVAGILTNATLRELERNKSKFNKYIEVGKEPKSDYDFEVLGSFKRTKATLESAFASLEQNQDKVNYALFWFLNTSPFDNTAIEYLKKGDEEKALKIWEKVTSGKNVNSKNFSAFNNLGTYKLLSRDKQDIKIGIEAKIKLIESDYFEDFVHSVADETHSIDNKKQSEQLIDDLLRHFKNKYEGSETMSLFSRCNGTTQDYLLKKFTEEPIYNIENEVESCKKKRKTAKASAYEFGLNLYKNTKDDLSLLETLLGNTDLKYKAAADQLANEIMQCGIDYFNECQENDSNKNYLESAQKLTKIAHSIAVGNLTKDRAKDSLATLEEMEDQEINLAIQVLQSIKAAYDNNARKVMAQVEEQEARMGYGQSINWTKVAEVINDSINWDKAIELIKETIPKENIIKIKKSQNKSKITEFKELVDFIYSKVSSSKKSSISYLQFWEEPQKLRSSKKRSSNIRKTSDYNSEKTGDKTWAESNPGCLISIACFIIGGILIVNEIGFGGILILLGFFAHKIDD